MKMIAAFEKTFTFSIRTFCGVVFSFQLYLLTQNYLQFNVHKEVTNYIANQIEVPEIHILIPYQFAFDINFLKRKYKSSFESSCIYFSKTKDCNEYMTNIVLFSKKFGPSLLLSDIAKHSYPLERFLWKLHWSESDKDPLEIGECGLKRRASAAYLVLVVSCLDSTGLPLKVSRARAAVYAANYFLGFPLNATGMLVKLIYPGKALVEDNSFYAFAANNPGKQVSLGIRFTKHTVNLLPAPYKTMCKNYDRRQVFEDCLNNHSIAQTGLLHPETTVDLEKYSQPNGMRFASSFNGDTKDDSLLKIFEICEAIVTQPMCNSVRYSFTMAATPQDVKMGEESFRFYFIISSEFDSLTESKADFPLSDYLIFSGSLVSTWFGISIMGQLLTASNFCCLTLTRKRIVEVASQNDKDQTQSNRLPDH